ncbi:hypothetical protein DID88_004437 [Monilinia fructigena]|uniref:Uncharacterized protein n=1 Tax=Monilinia fructigena TaxID=38457 RepID=A0A395IW70_9HELO|nr:hypothetical protein DID88_004437 [Monilinia fructigena]
MLLLTFLLSFHSFGTTEAASLYNGLHKTVLSADISEACDAALNTELNCDSLVQLTPYSIQSTKWTTSSLDLLCTTACRTGLAALHSVSQTACPGDTFSIDGNSISLHELVDFDSIEGVWGHLTDENGTCTEPDWDELDSVFDTSGRDDMSAMDYYVNAADPIDEQITTAGLAHWISMNILWKFNAAPAFYRNLKPDMKVLGVNTWDEVTEQVWANMQRNCELNEVFTPAHNVSGVIVIDDIVSALLPLQQIAPKIYPSQTARYTHVKRPSSNSRFQLQAFTT